MCLIRKQLAKTMSALRHPITAYDQILDRFYAISMEFLLVSCRNVPTSEERGEMAVFADQCMACKKFLIEKTNTFVAGSFTG